MRMNINLAKLNVGFIGLGYAGFPMACLFSRQFPVVGFDISTERVDELNRACDYCGDVTAEEIHEVLDRGARFTTDLEELRGCNFYVIVVPTPVDAQLRPDITCLLEASREVARVLSPGDVVVFESTVYPGATEELCVPVIEEESGLEFNRDFFVGYSPERINPGDKYHKPNNMVKVTSGSTPETADYIDRVYAAVLGEGHTYRASNIRVAEASKVVENTQRDVNIAFMNEITRILDAMDVDVNEVLDAMNTKWNALGFRPGLVGGHCIGVDPYYLLDRAMTKGISANLIMTARTINNAMPGYVTEKVIRRMRMEGLEPEKASVLLLGFTFKENCPDIRNTRVYDIYRLMESYTTDITIYDPWVDAGLAEWSYRVQVCTRLEELAGRRFDTIVICVAHDAFRDFDYSAYSAAGCVVYDVKGLLRQPHPAAKCVEPGKYAGDSAAGEVPPSPSVCRGK